MNKKTIAGGVVALLLFVLGAWWMGWFHQEEKFVAEIRELAAEPQTKENQQAMRNVMRERFEGVPEDQRMAVFEQLAPIFIPMMMSRFTADYDKLMAMSPEDRIKEIDRKIDEFAKRGGPPGMGGRGPGGGGPPGGAGGPGGPGGGGNRPQMDPKKMAEFQKKMLAWTTPEQRSKMDNGMQMFTARMKERGMDPPPMPGGGFF